MHTFLPALFTTIDLIIARIVAVLVVHRYGKKTFGIFEYSATLYKKPDVSFPISTQFLGHILLK